MKDWPPLLHWLAGYGVNTVEWLAAGFVIFTPLALLWPCKAAQPLLRRDMGADLLYFSLRLIYSPLQAFLLSFFLAGRAAAASAVPGVGALARLADLPLAAQVLLMLLVVDGLQYGVHRATHGRRLWPFHAVHHSSTGVDWLSGARWHPVNDALHIVPMALVASLGFAPDAFLTVAAIGGVANQLAHANLNWTYGPLRYVIASPVFHHWHHTLPDEGGEKNFSQLFSFYDLLFGTFYLPKGLPSVFGTAGNDVPERFIGQLLYPFRRKG